MLYDGKRVAIVGPSHSMTQNTSEDIESYDVVVRMNTGWPVAPENRQFVGERCDAFYHNCTPLNKSPCGEYKLERLLEHSEAVIDQFKLVCIPFFGYNYHKLKEFCDTHQIEVFDLRPRIWNLINSVWKPNQYHPNYGFVAIDHILSSEAKEVYITGISFYRQRYHQGHCHTPTGRTDRIVYSSENGSDVRHNPERELRYFLKELYPKNKHRLRLDGTLSRIVDMEKMI